ncbi:MAG: c-type cytochrome domain-containing protein, partial [Planctomycetota bacterium]
MSQATIRRAMTYLTLVIVLSTGRQSVWGQSDSIVYEVSYSEDVSTIIKEFCTTCHAGENPEGDLRLTSYESVREHVKEGNLLDRINNEDDPMPPSGLMPSYMRRVIKSWAGQGFIEQGTEKKTPANHSHRSFVAPKIVPVDVTRQGFELLRHLKGHWVGSMELMGQEFEWWAFDFRPISPSHIHGLFEGGTIGNLFTSFFVADFSGKKTIVARNGGLLNGIYRT